MTFHVVLRWGASEKAPTVERMREILTELDSADPEHPDTWLAHESGWTLSVFESGLVVWEKPEKTTAPRHMHHVDREHAHALWCALAQGRIADVDAEPWLPGYG